MKVLVLITVLAILGGAQAGFKETWEDLVSSLKDLGDHSLDKIKEIAGTLSDGALQKLIDALQKKDEAKRDLDLAELKQKLKDKLGDKYDEVAALLAPHMDKVKELIAKYKPMLQGLIDKIKNSPNIDEIKALISKLKAIAGLNKRDVDLAEIKQKLKEKFGDKYDQVKALLAPHMDKIKAAIAKYKPLVLAMINKIKAHPKIDQIKELIAKLKAIAGLAKRDAASDLKKYLEELENMMKGELKDKIIEEALNNRLRRDLGQKIKDMFKPHLDKINDLVSQFGDKSKETAKNTWEKILGHKDSLVEKLKPHLDKLKGHGETLVGHGKDAVDALKASITDILNETFQNMVGTIKDSIDTGKDAIGTIGEHVNGIVN